MLEVLDISPRVAEAHQVVRNYMDLLLLTSLDVIFLKTKISWTKDAPNLSPEAQTALITSLQGLTLKLTEAQLD